MTFIVCSGDEGSSGFLPRTILLHEYVPVRSDLYINDLKAFPSRAGAHSI
jgi:hypothetical protein